MSPETNPGTGAGGRAHKAGALDIRSVIAALLGVYGVILTVMGLVATEPADLAKADGVNANLWTGLGLLVASAVFALWVKLRPIVVEEPPAGGRPAGGPGH
ncbi:hypothetical protein NUM3379_29940 [Kineococcus sp. NUM-3379]